MVYDLRIISYYIVYTYYKLLDTHYISYFYCTLYIDVYIYIYCTLYLLYHISNCTLLCIVLYTYIRKIYTMIHIISHMYQMLQNIQ